MLALSWNRLTDITKAQKPYRGTTNRYPVGSRTQNTKNFYVDEIDGEKVYRIGEVVKGKGEVRWA